MAGGPYPGGTGRDDTPPPRRVPAAVARRALVRSVKLLVGFFALFYLVLPQIAGARKALSELLTVEPVYLVLGLALQGAALTAYTLMTRACLPPHAVPFGTLLRIQLATKAVTNVVPGGSAAGSAVGYRLLTLAGVARTDAGFALATAGMGSAVVLNVLLWLALLSSLPNRGVNPLYGTAAAVGFLLLTAFAAVVIGLMKGQARAERVIRAVGRRIRWVDEQRVVDVIGRVARRLRELLADPALVARVAFWAALNWILDAASLWVFLRAFGASVPLDGLLVAFGLANVLAAIPITPGGLGIVEGVLIPTLVGFGVPRSVAVVAVPMYRLAQFWLPIPVGAVSYLSLRMGPFAIDRARRLPRLRREIEEATEEGGQRWDWVVKFGKRVRSANGVNGHDASDASGANSVNGANGANGAGPSRPGGRHSGSTQAGEEPWRPQ